MDEGGQDAACPAVEHTQRSGAEGTLEDIPVCIICQDALKMEERRVALECGHVFHQQCLETYAECKNIRIEQACPYRCHKSLGDMLVIPDELEQVPAAASMEPEDEEAMQDLLSDTEHDAASMR